MSGAEMLEKLRTHRPLLLACEAIGWLHMTGKAHPDFLRSKGGAGVSYNEKAWHEKLDQHWSTRLGWLRGAYPNCVWPDPLTEFLQRYDDGRSRESLVGFLQAGHAMASGIEKNLPGATSGYLAQDANHLWLCTAFGHPVRNLLADPPEVLQPGGWERLLARIGGLLDELQRLGENPPGDPDPWHRWREAAVGKDGWLRRAFGSTLAETRLPNNEVTLWDQSYVAAALFKAAVAGAVLSASPNWRDLKSKTRWRVLTVAFGTDHYEARAVRIGDWTGARQAIERFLDEVCRLVEVDLALGSLVYRDDEAVAFTFPGLRLDATPSDAKGSLDDGVAEALRAELEGRIDELARAHDFETPPLCRLSASTRSFVPMTEELREARKEVAVPVHRRWEVPKPGAQQGHVCPVCQVRFNGQEPDGRPNVSKQRVCRVCFERRRGRLDTWLASGEDTIWITEVADANDRVALLTLSLDLEPWLDGSRVDSLRAQALPVWRRANPVLGTGKNRTDNPIDPEAPLESLRQYVGTRLDSVDKDDPVLGALQDGYRHATDWKTYFGLLVEDRAGAPSWDDLDEVGRANWLAHQLLRKNASPGRVHRFWRTAETFFAELLESFREIAAADANRWRTRRLVVEPAEGGPPWKDRETYAGRFRDAPLELLYRQDRRAFITICNLARVLAPHEPRSALAGASITVRGDDGEPRQLTIGGVREAEGVGVYTPLVLLDRTPVRFRVLVPLATADACVEAAVEKWRNEFARVWDRMPMRVGIVAFPRLTPFQAVVEMARNVEDVLAEAGEEKWCVAESASCEGVTSLVLRRGDGGSELVAVPRRLPDGRADVFYPYLRTEGCRLRSPRDFATPDGLVYRHVADLRPGDGVEVAPSRLAMVFMESTAARFEPVEVLPLSTWIRLRETWALVRRHAPSTSALRGAWAVLAGSRERWVQGADRTSEAAVTWCQFARSVLAEQLGLRGAALDALVEAACSGALERALDWHLRVRKEPLEEGT
ncbi:MAG: hypothetical protein KatS3mg102_2215 [Planctomycetota bacterium]|nr:MAG: hypothetical protein KatS3mg102_2215 [Planctomycetota bacterium]